MALGAFTAGEGRELTREDVRAVLHEPLEARAVLLRAMRDVLGDRALIVEDTQGVPLRLPRIDSWDLVDYWRGENQLIGESDPDVGELVLLPANLKSIKTLTRFSNELRRLGVLGIARALGESLTRRVARAFDRAALIGAGDVDGEGLRDVVGLANADGIQIVDVAGSATVDHIHDAKGALLDADADAASAVWFLNPRMLTGLRKLREGEGTGAYLLQPSPADPDRETLLGRPVYPTTQIPRNLGAGQNETLGLLVDLSQIAVGVDVFGTTFDLLTETFGQYDQAALRVVTRADLGPLNAEAVVKLDRVVVGEAVGS